MHVTQVKCINSPGPRCYLGSLAIELRRLARLSYCINTSPLLQISSEIQQIQLQNKLDSPSPNGCQKVYKLKIYIYKAGT